MNNQDLLKRVAEVAPEWMGAEVIAGAFLGKTWHEVAFSLSEDYVPTLSLENDCCDADAIVAMLDAIEKEGWTACVGSCIDEDGVRIPGYCCDCYDMNNCEPLSTEGSTRAEAVALAFVAVFGGKE